MLLVKKTVVAGRPIGAWIRFNSLEGGQISHNKWRQIMHIISRMPYFIICDKNILATALSN